MLNLNLGNIGNRSDVDASDVDASDVSASDTGASDDVIRYR